MVAGNVSQFLGALPIGYTMQAPYGISDPNWLKMDGTIINRAPYPVFSANSGNVGTFTTTIRAGMSTTVTSTANNISTNGTNMVVSTGATGLSSMQYSTNGGVTWAIPASGLVAGSNFSATALAGSNFVAATCNANSQPVYCSAASPSAWTAGTGVNLANGVIPTLAANAAGTVVMAYNQSAYVSTNSGVSYSPCTGVTTPTASSPPIVWTGTQFIIFSAGSSNGVGMQTSPTGAANSWTTYAQSPWGASYIVSAACSDGAGNVLVVSTANPTAWVSNNGGATWKETFLPQPASGVCSYANGRFFVPNAIFYSVASWLVDGSVAVSSDLSTWVSVPNFASPNINGNVLSTTTISFASGNYCAINATSVAPYTSTENMAQMYLPISRRSYPFTTNWQEWIKVQ